MPKPLLTLALSLALAACATPNNTREQSRNILNQAIAHYQAGEFQAALPLLQKSAALGNLKAPRYIGLTYLNGQGLPHDPAQAFAQFQAAANQGDITSQYWLGYLYQHGIGTTQDYTPKPCIGIRLSAVRGDHISAPAMLALGKIYANGLGVTANPATAASWYSQAIAAGDETISRQARAEMLRLNTPHTAHRRIGAKRQPETPNNVFRLPFLLRFKYRQ